MKGRIAIAVMQCIFIALTAAWLYCGQYMMAANNVLFLIAVGMWSYRNANGGGSGFMLFGYEVVHAEWELEEAEEEAKD